MSLSQERTKSATASVSAKFNVLLKPEDTSAVQQMLVRSGAEG